MNTLKFGNGEWYGKKDTILAYNDENSNYKPLPFDFSRASKATVINKDGLIEEVGSGQPRIDYKDDSKGALLLEPSRSNNLLQSNQFDTTWTKVSGVTLTPSEAISPDGNNNGWKFEKTASSYKSIGQNYTSSSETTFSIFAKKGTLSVITLLANINSGTNLYQRFDLENGIVSTGSGMSSSNIEEYGNGWYRCSSTFTNTNVQRLDCFLDFAENEAGFIYIYGAQAEVGSYATSYIPTSGSAVTRLADSCSQTVPDGVIGQTEGVMFLDVKMPSVIQSSTTFSIGGGASGEYAQLEIRSDLSINWRYRQGDVDYINANVGSYVGGDRLKLAFAYKNGSSVLYKNGVSIATDNGSIGSNSWNNVYFSNYAGTGKLNADVNQTSLYNTRLSNSELAALTQV